MKTIRKIFIVLIVVTSLFACSNKNDVSNDDTNDNNNNVVETGLFDNVKEITISFKNVLYLQNSSLTFNNQEALDSFINKIKSIESENEMIVGEEISDNPSIGTDVGDNYDENLGIDCITLNIRYNDDRNSVDIVQFDNGNKEIFKDGYATLITIDGEEKIYENNGNVILKTVIDLVKDSLHYLNVFTENNVYVFTDFLTPYEIKTDEYTITSSVKVEDLRTYWIDYIENNNFKMYEKDEEIFGIPDDGNEHKIILVDEKSNKFVLNYTNVIDTSDIYFTE